MHCNDKAKDMFDSGAKEPAVRSLMERCVGSCVDDHVNLIPSMTRRLKETLDSIGQWWWTTVVLSNGLSSLCVFAHSAKTRKIRDEWREACSSAAPFIVVNTVFGWRTKNFWLMDVFKLFLFNCASRTSEGQMKKKATHCNNYFNSFSSRAQFLPVLFFLLRTWQINMWR